MKKLSLSLGIVAAVASIGGCSSMSPGERGAVRGAGIGAAGGAVAGALLPGLGVGTGAAIGAAGGGVVGAVTADDRRNYHYDNRGRYYVDEHGHRVYR